MSAVGMFNVPPNDNTASYVFHLHSPLSCFPFLKKYIIFASEAVVSFFIFENSKQRKLIRPILTQVQVSNP